MKYIVTFFFIFSPLAALFAQTEATKFKQQELKNKNLSPTELISSLTEYDFSKVFTHADNSVVYGFIGDNYQRIRIKLIGVTKDNSSPNIYHVYGKSMVKNNVDKFTGTITITNIRRLKVNFYGVDEEYKNKGIKGEYIVLTKYSFSENKDQAHSGCFNGVGESDFYLDKNYQVHYDDIELEADGYTNNQFVGRWTDYKTNIAKRCNWGDFRIPNSGNLDIGAGEFSPDDKYLKYGWQSVRDIVVTSPKSKEAKKIEEAKWWE